MGRAIAGIAVILLIVVIVAFSRGWLTVQSNSLPEEGKQKLELTVDENKINADGEKVKQTVIEAKDSLQESLQGEATGDKPSDELDETDTTPATTTTPAPTTPTATPVAP